MQYGRLALGNKELFIGIVNLVVFFMKIKLLASLVPITSKLFKLSSQITKIRYYRKFCYLAEIVMQHQDFSGKEMLCNEFSTNTSNTSLHRLLPVHVLYEPW